MKLHAIPQHLMKPGQCPVTKNFNSFALLAQQGFTK